ncbi:MAG: DNA-3-methyladenine glycosylase [Verrucomicrobiota bacterium]|nr:DNA-3-methyladenine glycosylase [Verrucomicrobiota bacterium]
MSSASTYDAALEHLQSCDPVMRKLIRKVGPCRLEPQLQRPPFESLARAIAHQQLNGTAAETILRRFVALFPGSSFPSAKKLAIVTDDAIRAAGFSRAKIAALRDLAEKAISGVVPSRSKINSLSNEEIIERLTEIRGIGQWTVEMLLIFQLGRLDVLPADDFGVRTGFAKAYGLPTLPKPGELREFGERWRPFRTVASWYLWRAADAAKPIKAKKLPPLKSASGRARKKQAGNQEDQQ